MCFWLGEFLYSAPLPYPTHTMPTRASRASPMFPTCHPSYPSVPVQSPESPMRPSMLLEPSPSDSRPLRLATSLAHIVLHLPKPHRHHPCSLRVTLASLASQNSHLSPLRAHLMPLVSSTVTHNSLDLRLGLSTLPYTLPDHQVPIGSPPLALRSIRQAVPLHSHCRVCVPYLS
jgi:hypothetical protein